MYSNHYFFQILMKLEFSWQNFEKKSQISNFIKILPLEPICSTLLGGWAEVLAEGRDEASSCFSQFFEIAQKYLRATLQTILTLYRCVCS
jgi:hypothetical protein